MARRQASPKWTDRFQLNLRFDHLCILAVLLLVLYVLIFSFGVEKGKQIALGEVQARQKRLEETQKVSLALQASTPVLPAVPASDTVTEVMPPPGSTQPTAVVESTPPAQPEKVSTSGNYTIQVITFTSESRAEKETGKWKEKGFHSFVIKGGRFYQVCVLAFEGMNEAKQMLAKLQSEQTVPADAYIRPLKGATAL